MAVPDFVSGPIFVPTNKYSPPAVACVRSTKTLGRLQTTRVASSLWPETSNITSGVRLVHHEGGSTFVTPGALASIFGEGSVCPSKSPQQNRKGTAEKIRRTRVANKERNVET